MKFYMPTKVYDESGSVSAHASEWTACGTKALIVTGRNSAKACGALSDVTDELEKAGIEYGIFDKVEENPSVETVTEAAAFGADQKADFVIGIGGGSAMDASKAIAFLMQVAVSTADGIDLSDIEQTRKALYDGALPTAALPVIAIPTTCGTGSEVTGVSVLTRHDKQTKQSIPHKIFPAYALIDGRYLAKAPHQLIVNTSVDALAHMVESYLSSKADTYSRAAALSGLEQWRRIKDVLTGEIEADEEDLGILMRASTFAGIAIAQTGTSIPHALSYPITYHHHLAHGAACGYFLAGFLKEAAPADRKTLLSATGFADVDEFKNYLKGVLPDPQIPAEVLETAYNSVVSNDVRLKSCRFAVDADVLWRIVVEN